MLVQATVLITALVLCGTVSGCEDKLDYCEQVKDYCTCSVQRMFMRNNCEVTCGYCKPTGPVTPRPKPCVDNSASCPQMFRVCNMLPETKEICPLTCGVCKPSGTQAPAKITTKAPVKQTTKAPVKQTTKAPVKQTTKAPVKPTTKAPQKPDPNCKDLSASCKLTKSFCTTRKEMMMKNCPLTCGFCGGSGSAAKPATQAPAKPVTQAPAKPTTKAPAQQTGGSLSCSGKGMTPELRAKVVDYHNSLRSRLALGKEKINDKEGMAPSAKNMYKLTYDCELEKTAQKWADTCPDYLVKPHSGEKGKGENMHFIYMTANITPNMLVDNGLRDWWRELSVYGMKDKNWHYTWDVYQSGVGHFTAMAWGSTTRVGCATTTTCKGKGMNLGVLCCQYLEGGNLGFQPIYELGPACKKDNDCNTHPRSTCEASTGLCIAP